MHIEPQAKNEGQFGEVYARSYDLIYSDKNYGAECDYLEGLFSRYCTNKPSTILDLGCGTGGHAIILGQRGYHVTGVDRSKAMIQLAKTKASSQNLSNVFFHQGEVTNIPLNQTFDVAISMFSVVNYILSLEALQRMFYTVRKCLSHGSVFIFDFWNGIAVLNLKPENRVKVVERGRVALVRTVTPVMDPVRQLIENRYECFVLDGDRLAQRFSETHRLRFHFPSEVEFLASQTSFRILAFLSFMNMSGRITDRDWNVVAVAKAV